MSLRRCAVFRDLIRSRSPLPLGFESNSVSHFTAYREAIYSTAINGTIVIRSDGTSLVTRVTARLRAVRLVRRKLPNDGSVVGRAIASGNGGTR